MTKFIVKFLPYDNAAPKVVHRFPMPDHDDKGFYRDTSSWNWFNAGLKRGITAEDRRLHRTRCGYAPAGLYYTHDAFEDEWLGKIDARVSFQKRRKNVPKHVLQQILEQIDERKWPKVEHASIWDFYKYIGFDHKARRYVIGEAMPRKPKPSRLFKRYLTPALWPFRSKSPGESGHGRFYVLKDFAPHRQPIFWLGFNTSHGAQRQQIDEATYKKLLADRKVLSRQSK